MKKTRVCGLLGVEYPILQAGMPWVSNPELVAAVSEAGGLGVLHPSAGMPLDGNMVGNFRENIRRVKRLTNHTFGVSLSVANPLAGSLTHMAVEEGVRIVVTYGGSPALHTGFLKDNDVKVLHQVGTVRHARAAEAQGVDIVIAEGFEGGGLRAVDEVPNLVLLPQVADAVFLPVIVSGGVMDARGYVAALSLGAEGVQMGTRFLATHECVAHPKYKEALLKAIDTGTVIAGRYYRPTRLLRTNLALQLRNSTPASEEEASQRWESELGSEKIRAPMLEGEVDSSISYCGAGVGLVSEIMHAGDVVRSLAEGVNAVLASLR